MTPLFSIITCTYNSGEFLAKNLESVINQTFTDYEQIIVENNSTDSTPILVEKYRNLPKSKIRVVNITPRGISPAFNKGIQAARGKYLIHLNSDDQLYGNDVLAKVAKFIQIHPELDWFYGKANIVESSGQSIGIFPNRRIFQQKHVTLLKFFNYIPHQATFVKREVFAQHGNFDETIRTGMDPDMWMRISPKTDWGFIDLVVCNYTIRQGAQSSGKARRKENIRYYEAVQRRYLNKVELVIAHIINFLVDKYNQTYR